MTAQTERQKTAELLVLLQKVPFIPQDGLGRFIRGHLHELPIWIEWLGPDPSNAQIASKVGRRLSSLAYQDKIYCGNGRYMLVENARRDGLLA